MYQVYDYFDEDLRHQPYSSAAEELEDYLRLLDMMLEGYLEFKGMNSERKLFSRGLVITESELAGYFSNPPYFRERDIWDPVLTACAEAAFSYIDDRTNLTAQKLADEELSAQKQPEAYFKRLCISRLKDMFSLSRTELLAVILALAPEIDRRYERIFGFLQDDVSKGTPSVGLLYALMGRITTREGSKDTIPMPLDERMYTYFLVKKDGKDGLSSPLTLHPFMKKILTGAPTRLSRDMTAFRLYEEDPNIPLFFDDSFKQLTYILSKENNSSDLRDARRFADKAVYLGNDDDGTVLHILNQYCAKQEEKLYVLDLQQLRNMLPEKRYLTLSELFLHLKVHNGRLALYYIPEEDSKEQNQADREAEIAGILDDVCGACSPHIIFLFGQKEEPGELASLFIPLLKIPDAPFTLRTKIWSYFMNAASDVTIAEDVVVEDLADCYEIPYGKVRKVVGHAIATARLKKKAVIDRGLVLDSLRQMNQVDFSGLATYVNPAYTWEDITITEMQKEVMKTACDRYRLRNRIGEGWGLKRRNAYGNGVSILLYGPPGTGKTMGAQVIANELALPLYRVDISQISSKYIGETEKNLAVIFNAAAKANVILFFDEADALFSKRTSVGDSHDKYANSETAYLLQKIEEYDGMSILSTNYYNNFDDAFVRRITYSVHMEQPDKETRYTLWTTILPKKARISKSVDFRFLADKFELSGSNIKAILFNAAYMAGAEKKSIGMKHIVRALEYEFNKLGKLVNSSDFGKYEVYLQNVDEGKAPAKK